MVTIVETGHAEIDQQHAQLVACLNELRRFAIGRYSFAAGFTAIQTLISYTEEHFAFEEELLRQWGHPESAEHIEQHRSLVAEVSRMWELVEREGADIAEDVVDTIERWIVDHINLSDVKFARHIRPG